MRLRREAAIIHRMQNQNTSFQNSSCTLCVPMFLLVAMTSSFTISLPNLQSGRILASSLFTLTGSFRLVFPQEWLVKWLIGNLKCPNLFLERTKIVIYYSFFRRLKDSEARRMQALTKITCNTRTVCDIRVGSPRGWTHKWKRQGGDTRRVS